MVKAHYTSMAMTLIVLMLISLVFSGNGLAKELKIGYVDVFKVMNDSNIGKSMKKDIAERANELEKEFTTKGEELKNFLEETRRKSTLFSEETLKLKELEYQKRLLSLQELKESASKELGEKKAEVETDLRNNIREIIDKIGKEENFDAILEKAAVIYNKSFLDITDRIIKLLDDKMLSIMHGNK